MYSKQFLHDTKTILTLQSLSTLFCQARTHPGPPSTPVSLHRLDCLERRFFSTKQLYYLLKWHPLH